MKNLSNRICVEHPSSKDIQSHVILSLREIFNSQECKAVFPKNERLESQKRVLFDGFFVKRKTNCKKELVEGSISSSTKLTICYTKMVKIY